MDTANTYEMKINRMYRDRYNEALWNEQNLIQYTNDEKMKAVKSYLSSKMAELGQRKQGAADKETFEAGQSIQNLMDMMKVMGFIVMSLEGNSDSNDFDDAKETLRSYDSKNFTADYNRMLYYFGEDMIFEPQMLELGELATQMDNLVASTRRGEVEVFIENAGDVFSSIKDREEQQKKEAAEIALKLEDAGFKLSTPSLLDRDIKLFDNNYENAVKKAQNAREQLQRLQNELKNNRGDSQILSEEEFSKYTQEQLDSFAKYPDVWNNYNSFKEEERRLPEERDVELKAFSALEAEMRVINRVEENVKSKEKDVENYAERIRNHEAEQAEYDQLSAKIEDYEKKYPDEAAKIEQQKKAIDYAARLGETVEYFDKLTKKDIQECKNELADMKQHPENCHEFGKVIPVFQIQKVLSIGGPENEALMNRFDDFFKNENTAESFPVILSELKKTAERAQENISKDAVDFRQMKNRCAELSMYKISPEELQDRKQNLEKMKTELEADKKALEDRRKQFAAGIRKHLPYSERDGEVNNEISRLGNNQTPEQLESLKNEVQTFHEQRIESNKASVANVEMEYEKVRSKLPEKVDGNLIKQADLIRSYQQAEKEASKAKTKVEKMRDAKTLLEGFIKKKEASVLANIEDLKKAKILQEPKSRMQNTLLDQLQSARGRLISKKNDSKSYKAMTSALDNAIRVMSGKDENGKPIPKENMAAEMKTAMENVKKNAQAYQTAKKSQWFHFSWFASSQRVNRLAATESLLNICSNADTMLKQMPENELTVLDKIEEKTAHLEQLVSEKSYMALEKEATEMVAKAIEERRAEKKKTKEQTLQASQQPTNKKDVKKI